MIRVSILALVMAVLFTACGEGKNPLDITVNAGKIPSVGFPFTPSGPVVINTQGYYLQAVNANVASPVAGVVTAIEASGSLYSITIYFNPIYSVRLSQLNVVPQVRVGEFVQVGQLLGTVINNQQILLSVLQNGSITCPYSYLDTAAKNLVNAVVGAPCP